MHFKPKSVPVCAYVRWRLGRWEHVVAHHRSERSK